MIDLRFEKYVSCKVSLPIFKNMDCLNDIVELYNYTLKPTQEYIFSEIMQNFSKFIKERTWKNGCYMFQTHNCFQKEWLK